MANPIPTQLSPGVNVSEIDLSTFVQPQAFNGGGMAGVFNWGPGLVATRVSSESELAAIFGKPTLDQSDLNNNMDFLAASNFLRYSPNLKVVRVMQADDFNAVSPDIGITWINSVDHVTIKNEDEFRSLGGFSASSGIETTSHFKARYPGNFGNALGVIVYDGSTGQTVEFSSQISLYKDYLLSGGYANPNTLSGISGGTASVTLQASVIEAIEVTDDFGNPLDPPQFVNIRTAVPQNKNGFTSGIVNWKMVTFDVPAKYNSASEFITDFSVRGKFLYASGTTSQNRTLTENGSNPDGNNGNCVPLRLFNDASGRETNPYNEFGIFTGGYARSLIAENPTNARKVDFLFLEFDNTNFFTNFRPGQTASFGNLGVKTIFAVLPTASSGLPSSFDESIFKSSSNLTDILNDAPELTLDGFYQGNRLWKYTINWSGVSAILTGQATNGLGWVNLIGMTGSRNLRTRSADGTLGTTAINFDSATGITGIRNNFAYGIVQLGDDSGAFTTTLIEESYESTRIFDKMPNTSKYADAVGGSNDEVSIAVIDIGGKFGPRGSILEKFELLSKATDAKNANNESIYYKDYINANSNYIYCTKAFALTGGGSWNSLATTSFGDIFTQYTSNGFTYNRTGYYDAAFDYGQSSTSAVTDAETIEGYSIFQDDDSAVDVLFIPESSVSDDTSTDTTTIEQLVYDSVIATRKDTLFVVPTPPPTSGTQHSSLTTNNAIQFRKNNLQLPQNSYTMVVAGRKLFFDTFNNQIRKMSLASDVAGILAAQEIAWESPAGFARGNLKNVIRLETKFSKGERDELYKNQINFFNEFNDGSGTVLFGDKTLLTKPSAFDRINVRRVFIAAEKAIAKAAKYSLFEFNDEFTRAQFRNLVIPFLRNLQSQKGIYDFKVVCDETNNTAQVIDNNQFVADIYIKPAKSINFIQLNFIAVKSNFALTTVE